MNVFYVGIACVVALVAVGAIYLVRYQQAQQKRTLSVITRGASLAERDEDKRQSRAAIAKKLKGADKESGKADDGSIHMMLIHAGFPAVPARFWAWSGVVWLCTALFLYGITSWYVATILIVAAVVAWIIPRLFLKWKAARRQKKFLEEFSDALDASVRLLQAGMPINEAIAMASREFTGPLQEEMLRIYENQKIGVPLGQAALETADRIPLAEVNMFATALQIQSETGGSLSEVLTNLSAVIRARFRLKRKIKALSSEARASASIIASLPVLVSLGLYAVNEKYISILFEAFKGKMLLGGAVFWMLCGVLVMRQMINFRI